jgi:hypothetical protein
MLSDDAATDADVRRAIAAFRHQRRLNLYYGFLPPVGSGLEVVEANITTTTGYS